MAAGASPQLPAGREQQREPSGMAQHGTTRHSMTWASMAWHSTAWHSMAWCCPIWHGMAFSNMASQDAACPDKDHWRQQQAGKQAGSQRALSQDKEGFEPSDDAFGSKTSHVCQTRDLCDRDMACLRQGQTLQPTGSPGPAYLPTDRSAPTGSCVSGGTTELGQSPASMGNLRACGVCWEFMSGPWTCLTGGEWVDELGEHETPGNDESTGGTWGDPSQPRNPCSAHPKSPRSRRRRSSLSPNLAAHPPPN